MFLFDSTNICTACSSIPQNSPNMNKLKILTLHRHFQQRTVTDFQQQEKWFMLIIWRQMAWCYRVRVACSPFNLLMRLLAREYFTEHTKLSGKKCILRQILVWSMTTCCEVSSRRIRRSTLYGMCGLEGLTELKGRPTLPSPGLILQYNRVKLDSSFKHGD